MHLESARVRTARGVPNDVDVFLFSTDQWKGLLDTHVALLGETERNRASATAAPAGHLLSYILLRLVLSTRTGIPPEDLDLRVGVPGFRTHLHGADPIPRISLARSQGLVAIALAQRAVGVDVEKHLSPRDAEVLVKTLHPRDQKKLNDARDTTAAWTRKEATLKAMAVGLSRDPGLDETGTRLRPKAPQGWAVRQLRPPKGLGAELAVAWEK